MISYNYFRTESGNLTLVDIGSGDLMIFVREGDFKIDYLATNPAIDIRHHGTGLVRVDERGLTPAALFAAIEHQRPKE